jgi:hypothetical protein
MSLIKIYGEKESVKPEAMAVEKRVLLVVLPCIVKPLASDTKKKSVRSLRGF